MNFSRTLLLLGVLWVGATTSQSTCPASCSCGLTDDGGVRMECRFTALNNPEAEGKNSSGRNPTVFEQMWENNPNNASYFFFSNVTQLDLADNNLEVVKGGFSAFPNLQELSLKRNQIWRIEGDSFRNLSELLSLDLSDNKLTSLNASMFTDLTRLETLNLAGNKITRLSEDTFDELPTLRSLDLSRNELRCDCHLKWMVRWSRKNAVAFAPGTVCRQPAKMQGRSFKQLKRKDLHCNWPVQVPVFEMSPAASQVVFQGDQLMLRCHVAFVDSSASIKWLHDTNEVSSESHLFTSITQETQQSPDGSTITSFLLVRPLNVSHSGTWSCLAQMQQGNRMHKVNILVISQETKYCSQTVTTNNKGRFLWPKAVVGVKVELPCEGHYLTSAGYQPSQAFYTCNDEGVWENLNTSQCAFISEVTKVLEQFSKTNLSISNKASVAESVRRLRNYTGDGHMLQDPMDIVFIARTVENYLEYIPRQKEIGEVLIDVVSTVMLMDKELLREAQVTDRACSRLIQAIEKIPELVTEGTLNRYRDNIAIEEFVMKPKRFSGMTCTSYVRLASGHTSAESPYSEKVFECNTVDTAPKMLSKDQVVEASIQLPASIFEQVEKQQQVLLGNTHKLQFAIYRNSKLFPLTSFHLHPRNSEVTTSIIASQIAKYQLVNLTDPVVVQLRVQVPTDDVIPVWWDFDANANFGDWTSEGCGVPHQSRYDEHLIIFKCNRLASFGLLQDLDQVRLLQLRRQGAKFRLSHPVVYVGSAVLIFCLIVVILVYLCFSRFIKMPKKTKHSLVNTWLAIGLLCFMFSVGVYQTENLRVCQSVGLILHYLTICVLLWMIITVSNMYKKLTKHDSFVEQTLSDEPPLPPKPMLRFYLVGWGVAIIICGISGAVNMEDYAGYTYCFLAFGPSLGAFYGPVGGFVFILCVFFCLIHCVITNSDGLASGQISASETPGVELITSVTQPSVDAHSITSSDIADTDRLPINQLRAHAVVLLLFVLMWASAAMATAHPFAKHIQHDEIIFSCVYCVVSTALGSFILVFFCLSRRDVRLCWKRLGRCRRWGNVYDTAGPLAPPLTNSNGHVCHSTHSLESAFTNKSSHTSRSVESSAGKMAEATAAAAAAAAQNKVPSFNTLLCNSHPTCPTNPTVAGPEMFYNARQNGIARRFFEKSRRQQLKLSRRNSRAKTDGDVSSDGSNAPQEQQPRHRRDRKHCTSLLSAKTYNIGDHNDPQFLSLSQPLNIASDDPIDDTKALVKNEEIVENNNFPLIRVSNDTDVSDFSFDRRPVSRGSINNRDASENDDAQNGKQNDQGSQLPKQKQNQNTTHSWDGGDLDVTKNEKHFPPNYAYVNHSYQQKGGTNANYKDTESPLKRSASASEQFIQNNVHSNADVWTHKQQEEAKLKKETSV